MVSFKRHENKAKMDGWVGIHKVPNRQEQTSWLHRCRPCLTLCVVSTWMLVLPHSPVLKDLQTKPERVHRVSWNQILVWMSTAQRHCVTQCSPLLHAGEMKEKAHWVWCDKSLLAKPSSKETAEIMTGCRRDCLPQRKVPLGFPPNH